MDAERRIMKIVNDLHSLRNGTIRIGDARREEVTDLLSRAYEQGFIDRDEHDKRLDIVMEAKYEHQLWWADEDLVNVVKPRLPAYNPNIALIDDDVVDDVVFMRWFAGIMVTALIAFIIIMSLVH